MDRANRILACWLKSLVVLGITISGATSTAEAPIDLNPKSILRDAYEAALQIESASSRASSLRFIAEAQASADDLTGALNTASLIPPSSGDGFSFNKEDTFAVIVGVRAEIGDVTGALQVLTRLQNAGSYQYRALADIAAAQARKGQMEEAFQTIVPIRDSADRAYAVNEIAAGQAQSGDDEGAVQTASAISDEYFRASAMKSVAIVQIQRRDFSRALKTLAHIPPSREDERNEVLWSMGLEYAHAGDFDTAVRTVRSLEGNRDDALLDIAEVQAKGGQAASARRLASLVQPPWARAIGLQGIARALMHAGYKEQASKTLQLAEQTAVQEKEDDLKEHARMHCIIARAVLGDVPGALRSASTLPNQEEPHDTPKRHRALVGVAQAQALGGDITGAFQTAEVIYENVRTAYLETRYPTKKIEQSVRRSVWPKILKAAVLAGYVNEALNRARQVTDQEIKAEALLKIAEGLLETKQDRPRMRHIRNHRFGFPV
jgi:hypothetical protein